MSVFVCTICSGKQKDQNDSLKYLLETAAKFNINPYIFWTGRTYRGDLSDKIIHLYDGLKALAVQEEYILYIDAFDILFYSTLDQIEEKFRGTQSSVLFGAEKVCYPVNDSDKFPTPEFYSENKYLNAGCFIGERRTIFDCLEIISKRGRGSQLTDQVFWSDLFLEGNHGIKLDYKCSIFQNCSWKTTIDLKRLKSKVLNSRTLESPCIFHSPGGKLKNGQRLLPNLLYNFLFDENSDNNTFCNPWAAAVVKFGATNVLKSLNKAL